MLGNRLRRSASAEASDAYRRRRLSGARSAKISAREPFCRRRRTDQRRRKKRRQRRKYEARSHCSTQLASWSGEGQNTIFVTVVMIAAVAVSRIIARRYPALRPCFLARQARWASSNSPRPPLLQLQDAVIPGLKSHRSEELLSLIIEDHGAQEAWGIVGPAAERGGAVKAEVVKVRQIGCTELRAATSYHKC